MTNSIHEIRDADCIFITGSNTAEAHPVISYEVIRAAKRGAHLIILDPRRIPLVDHATLHLQARGGSDIYIFLAMMPAIVAGAMIKIHQPGALHFHPQLHYAHSPGSHDLLQPGFLLLLNVLWHNFGSNFAFHFFELISGFVGNASYLGQSLASFGQCPDPGFHKDNLVKARERKRKIKNR